MVVKIRVCVVDFIGDIWGLAGSEIKVATGFVVGAWCWREVVT